MTDRCTYPYHVVLAVLHMIRKSEDLAPVMRVVVVRENETVRPQVPGEHLTLAALLLRIDFLVRHFLKVDGAHSPPLVAVVRQDVEGHGVLGMEGPDQAHGV